MQDYYTIRRAARQLRYLLEKLKLNNTREMALPSNIRKLLDKIEKKQIAKEFNDVQEQLKNNKTKSRPRSLL
jgi:CHAD domain-containing protein